MDRRIRKTKAAIFGAFSELLSQKEFSQITVEEIIIKADVSRATFYSHFETKDFLLKELCEELFCHIFDIANNEKNKHRHIFEGDCSDSVILHLFQHLKNNDNNILTLLASQNNELFLRYFKDNFKILVENNSDLFCSQKSVSLPDSFWKNHIVSTFVETLRWWADNKTKESPETITEYFFAAIQ